MLEAMNAMEKGYPYIKAINDEVVLACFVGIMIDQWISDHDKDHSVGDAILKNVLAVRGAVFDLNGMMPKTDCGGMQ